MSYKNEFSENLSDKELTKKIKNIKSEYRDELLILGHHYQRDDIIELSDIRGDSFELAKRGSQNQKAKYIVFCGVKFMAEAAAILSKSHQTVQHPDITAGCPLADMAFINDVEIAWKDLDNLIGIKSITPLTYMNSDSKLKAFCGKHGGSVTTSSNCKKIFQWAFKQKERIFFFPDEHLGTNTVNALEIPRDKFIIWNPKLDLGGNHKKEIENAKVILWKGHCHVHTLFTTEHIKEIRKKYPQAKIIVHPECTEDVVNAVDESGSTSQIIKYVEKSPPNSTIVIGTEFNLVNRLANEHKDKKIVPLYPSTCGNMMKINLNNLYETLNKLGKHNVVKVDDMTKKYAGDALQKMLEIT